MPAQDVTSISDLDLGVAERQAFGTVYARPARYKLLTELVVEESTLHLPPHPDWQGDVTDWAADPLSDRNWQFQHHTLRWLNPLRWSALEGDERAADEWRRVMKSWGEGNVPADKAPGLFAWKDMADGNRAIQLALGAPLLKPEDDWYLPLLRYHVEWLLDEAHLATRNHALHQHQGLLVAAAVLRDGDTLQVAYDRMAEQFRTTFDAQGANDEGAVGYHEMNLKWWSQAWARVEAEGLAIPDFAAESLDAGRAALARLVLPSGLLPQIGDTKRMPVSKGLGQHVDYVASQGVEGTAPEGTFAVYDRGYIASRSGWGEKRPLDQESQLLVRFGHDVLAHSHHDRGSVHLYTRGRTWLTDSGFYSYQTADPTRSHFLSRAAHNLAHLPEFDHNDRAEVELERSASTDDYHDAVLRDHGYVDVELRRRVLYLTGPECWIIWDESSEPTPIEQGWLVDAGVTALRHDRGFELRSEDQRVTMSWLGHAPGLTRSTAQEEDLRGWIATKWKHLEAGSFITAKSAANRKRQVTMIAPTTPVALGLVRSYVTLSGELTAGLMRGDRVWNLKVDSNRVAVSEGIVPE